MTVTIIRQDQIATDITEGNVESPRQCYKNYIMKASYICIKQKKQI